MIHNIELVGTGAVQTLAAWAIASGRYSANGPKGGVGLPAASGQRAMWMQFISISTNSGVARIGDSNTNSTNGLPLPAGAGQFFPPCYQEGHLYALSQISVYVANGDVVSVAWDA